MVLEENVLQGAEQKVFGKQYLDTSVVKLWHPLIKTGMLSSTKYKQADETFKQNSNLMASI